MEDNNDGRCKVCGATLTNHPLRGAFEAEGYCSKGCRDGRAVADWMAVSDWVACPVCFADTHEADAGVICAECGAKVEESGGWVDHKQYEWDDSYFEEVFSRAHKAGAYRIMQEAHDAMIRITMNDDISGRDQKIALIVAVRPLEAELNKAIAICSECLHKGKCVGGFEKQEVCAGIGPRWAASNAHNRRIQDAGACDIPGCTICDDDDKESHNDPRYGSGSDEYFTDWCDGLTEDQEDALAHLEDMNSNGTMKFFLTRLAESVTVDEIADGLLGGLSTWGRGDLAKRLAMVGSPEKPQRRSSKQIFVFSKDGGEEILRSEARGTVAAKPKDRG